MKRVLCLWLPNWPIQRQWLKQPEVRSRPLVLFATAQRDQQVVAACCRSARGRGIRVGMPLAEAKAIGNDRSPVCVTAHDPLADRAALKRLAWACDRFTPLVGMEASDHPECLLLDITGCGPVFRGEENLACQLHQHVRQWCLEARIAIAGTVGLAWAVAHATTDSQAIRIVAPENEGDTLRRLPVDALRLSANVLGKLRQLGIRRVEELLALPRESLPSRFGTEITERLDQLQGHLPEPIVPERRPEPVDALWETEMALCDEDGLSLIMTELLRRLLDKLQATGEGMQQVVCDFTDAYGNANRLSLELLRPTTDIGHVLELLQLQWERLTFGEGVLRIHVQCKQAALIPAHQQDLIGENADRQTEREFEQLIERLSSRLGRDAVLRPRLVAEAQPEHSYRFIPCLDVSATHDNDSDNLPVGSQPLRPLWLKRLPVRLDVLSTVPAGPPYWIRWQSNEYVIAHAWGPERITAGWWNGPHVRRDYYVVEAESGHRFWLFRDLADERWYLHAEFD